MELLAEAGDRKDIHKLAVSLVRSNRPLAMELFATISSDGFDRQALRLIAERETDMI